MKRYIRSDNTLIGDLNHRYIMYNVRNHYSIVDKDNRRDQDRIVEQFDSDDEGEAAKRLQAYINKHPRRCDKITSIYLYLSKAAAIGDYNLVGDHIEVVLDPEKSYDVCMAILKKKLIKARNTIGCKIDFRGVGPTSYVIYQLD